MKNVRYEYVQWSSPEELHQACIAWESELEFIKDEQQFLDELINSYTLSLISKEVYNEAVKLITELSKEEVEVNDILTHVKEHANKLEILVDGIDQIPEEKLYKEAHYHLKIEVERYESDFKKTKTKIFDLVKLIMKQQKQTRLLRG